MNRQEHRHGLELHHELGTHEEVESRLCNAQALVPNRNRHFGVERDPLQAKLHDESSFVDRFEEARGRGGDEPRLPHAMRPRVELPGRFLGVLWDFGGSPFRSRPNGGAVAGRTRSLNAVVLSASGVGPRTSGGNTCAALQAGADRVDRWRIDRAHGWHLIGHGAGGCRALEREARWICVLNS